MLYFVNIYHYFVNIFTSDICMYYIQKSLQTNKSDYVLNICVFPAEIIQMFIFIRIISKMTELKGRLGK